MTRITPVLSSACALFAILVSSTAVEAQRGGGGGRGGPGAAAQIPQFVTAALEHHEDVGLDTGAVEALRELKVEVDEAFEPFQKRLEAARGSGDRSGMRELFEEMGGVMAPFAERFNALVTEEQRAELRQYVPQRGRRGGGGF